MCCSLGPALRAGRLYDPFLGTTPFSGHSPWSPAAVERRPWRAPGARSPSASEPRRRTRRALAGGHGPHAGQQPVLTGLCPKAGFPEKQNRSQTVAVEIMKL